MSDYVSNHDVHPDAPAGGGGPGRFHTGHSPLPAGSHHHDASYTAHHYAHIAHQAHLGAEGAEFVAHQLHRSAKYFSMLTKAQQVMATRNKMALDLRLMRRAMKTLENAATKSGDAKAAVKLGEMKVAYSQAKAVYDAERSVAASASQLLELEHEARISFQGIAKLKLGQAVLGFEHVLHGSAIGRGLLRTGKVIANPKFVKGLMIVGAAVEGFAGWIDSNAETTTGKAANAALAAGGGALVMANPIVAGADVVLPKGYKVSEVYQGTAGALTAIGEGFATSDERAMAKFHERSKRGDYGKVMQASSEAGDYWADKGLKRGISEFFDAVADSIASW